jgi:anti-sigma28 factor (negative regulator of flagellin synthesis)
MTTWEQRELTTMARALCRVEARHSRVDEIAKAIESGIYRVPAQIIAACLIFEILQ